MAQALYEEVNVKPVQTDSHLLLTNGNPTVWECSPKLYSLFSHVLDPICLQIHTNPLYLAESCTVQQQPICIHLHNSSGHMSLRNLSKVQTPNSEEQWFQELGARSTRGFARTTTQRVEPRAA